MHIAVGALLSVAFFWLAARGVSWSQVTAALTAARYGLVALAVTFVVAGTVLRTWCWIHIYGPTPTPIPFARAWGIVLIGQFLNIGVPARVGDVARSYLIGEAGGFSKTRAATSLVVEKFFDLTTFLVILLLISVRVDLPPVLENARGGLMLSTLAVAVMVLVAVCRAEALRDWLARLGRARGESWLMGLARHLEAGLGSLAILRRWQTVLLLQVGYLGVWASLGLTTHLVLVALGLDLSLVAPLVVLAVVQLGTAVPSTPGKVGVFQYLSVLALVPFGVVQDAALTVGILLHLVSYLPPVVLGSVGFWIELPGLRRTGVISERSTAADSA